MTPAKTTAAKTGAAPVRPAAAPPVYRPQPTPAVLQRKAAAAARPAPLPARPSQPPKAPPVYRPQAAPRVLQTKQRPAPPPRPGAVVQRYTQEGQFLVSENRQMAITSEGTQAKEFYASRRLLDESNRSLGALGSPIILEPAEAAPEQLAGLFKVVPRRRDSGPRLFASDKCVDVGGSVAGAPLDKLVYGKGEQVFTRDASYEGEGVKPLARFLHDTISGDARQLNAFLDGGARTYNLRLKGRRVRKLAELKDVLPDASFRRAFGLTLRDAVANEWEQDWADAVARRYSAEVMNSTVSNDVDGEAVDAYSSEMERIADEVKKRSETNISRKYQLRATGHENMGENIGVNRSADPEVGEAFVVFATRERANGWPYHVATVVARDGSDKVTLENFNRRGEMYSGDEVDIDQRFERALDSWHFRLYGPREQSFHDQWKKDVAGALTVRAAPFAHEPFKRHIAEEIQKRTQKEVGAEVGQAIDRAQTRAELLQILFKATGAT